MISEEIQHLHTIRLKQRQGEDKKNQEKLQRNGIIPIHIAVIMDGNGRWAKKRGLPRIAGHKEGVESVRDIVEACGQLGIQYLTLYAFSTENWKRPKYEVSMLMLLLMRALRDETEKLLKNNVRVQTIGDIGTLPNQVQEELSFAIEKTKFNTGLVLLLALSYSGRWDITNAVKSISSAVKRDELKPEDVSNQTIEQYLSTKGIPHPDLLIRTSGEFRISNFLLWQLAYSEIHISDILWPDFRRKQLYEVIAEFQRRERRFGLVSEQLISTNKKQHSMKKIFKQVTGL